MKFEIKKDKLPRQFEPIEIKIIVENFGEFRELWHRLNIAKAIFNSSTYSYESFCEWNHAIEENHFNELWKELDDIRQTRGIDL